MTRHNCKIGLFFPSENPFVSTQTISQQHVTTKNPVQKVAEDIYLTLEIPVLI
jgi:hypothetical protein